MLDYTHGPSDAEMPKRTLVCDFQTLVPDDLETGEKTAFALQDLPKHVERFAFVLGRQVQRFEDKAPVNIKAAELVGARDASGRASSYGRCADAGSFRWKGRDGSKLRTAAARRFAEADRRADDAAVTDDHGAVTTMAEHVSLPLRR